jgi:hypothetical protein
MRLIWMILGLALFFALLSGCAGVRVGRMVEPAPAAELPLPSATPRATRTPTPTSPPVQADLPTITPTPTAALTATLPVDITGAELLAFAWYDDYDMMLAFQFPGPVQPEQVRVQMERKEFACQVVPQFPDRLYCKGQGSKVLAWAWVRLFPAGSIRPVLEQRVWVPYFTNDYSQTFQDEFGAVFPAYEP